jgi:hypothetical protein
MWSRTRLVVSRSTWSSRRWAQRLPCWPTTRASLNGSRALATVAPPPPPRARAQSLTPFAFSKILVASLASWTGMAAAVAVFLGCAACRPRCHAPCVTVLSAAPGDGKRGIWLRVPIGASHLIPMAVKEGFAYHHARPEYAMLTKVRARSRDWFASKPSQPCCDGL